METGNTFNTVNPTILKYLYNATPEELEHGHVHGAGGHHH